MAPSCDQRLDVTTYGLHRSQHYTAMVAAYNENISIKSKKVDLCMSLIVIPVLLCRLMYIIMAILYLHAIMHITLAPVRIIMQRYVLPFDAQVVTNTPSISYNILCCVSDTSAVQSVDVVKGEECVVVTCYFAAGSNARGCALQMKIVATYTSQHLHLWHFNISRDPDLLMGTLHVPLEPKTSVVEVTVHDLTVSGRVGFLSIPPHISHSSTFHC